MNLGYARVSTTKQDPGRQIDAPGAAGIAPERVYAGKKSGAATDRPGLTTLLGYARDGAAEPVQGVHDDHVTVPGVAQ